MNDMIGMGENFEEFRARRIKEIRIEVFRLQAKIRKWMTPFKDRWYIKWLLKWKWPWLYRDN